MQHAHATNIFLGCTSEYGAGELLKYLSAFSFKGKVGTRAGWDIREFRSSVTAIHLHERLEEKAESIFVSGRMNIYEWPISGTNIRSDGGFYTRKKRCRI